MQSGITRYSIQRPTGVFSAFLLAVIIVSGGVFGRSAIAHDGQKHTDENPHVLYGTDALLMMERGEVIATDTHLNEEGPVWYLLVRNPLTTNLWECTGTFPLSSREEAAAWRCIGGFYREHRALTEPEYPEY